MKTGLQWVSLTFLSSNEKYLFLHEQTNKQSLFKNKYNFSRIQIWFRLHAVQEMWMASLITTVECLSVVSHFWCCGEHLGFIWYPLFCHNNDLFIWCVFYVGRNNDRGSVDQNSVDRNCVLSLDRIFFKASEQSGRNDWIGYDERMIARVFFFFTYLPFKIGLPQIPTNSR